MRVWKPTYGAGKKTSRYHVKFRDHGGVHRQLPAYTNKGASVSLGLKLETLAAFRATGKPLDGELAAWVAGVSDDLGKRLVRWGMVDEGTSAMAQPLTELIDEYIRRLRVNGRGSGHMHTRNQQIRAVCTACGFEFFRDIRPGPIEAWGVKQVEGGAFRKSTWHFHVQAIKSFCDFIVRTGAAAVSPLAGLNAMDVDDARPRGIITRKQLGQLMTATRKTERCGIRGADRALTYWLAFESCLRGNAIRELTPRQLHIDRKDGVIVGGWIDTIQRKGRGARERAHRVPITTALAEALEGHTRRLSPSARLFRLPTAAARMIRCDLLAAGLPTCDSEGHLIQFHSLRHSGVTWLMGMNVDPQTVKQVSGHRTDSMLSHYADHADLAAAQARLAELDIESPLAATGTDDLSPGLSPNHHARTCTEAHTAPNMALTSERTPVASQQVGADIFPEH